MHYNNRNSISIFGGLPLPWTNEATASIKKFDPEGKQGARGVAGKKLSPEELEKLKSRLVKPIVSTKKDTVTDAPPAPAKKGFFGLF